MKLRNKKTGEIGNLLPYGCEDGKMWVWVGNISRPEYRYNSLAELNEKWEDAPEEPKDFWFIDAETLIACESTEPLLCDKKVAIETMKQIGNYFENKEEAEKAVEKLKAWKRLEDKGFRFDGVEVFSEGLLGIDGVLLALEGANDVERSEIIDSLQFLFGGEE